jgi:hypothetical protein
LPPTVGCSISVSLSFLAFLMAPCSSKLIPAAQDVGITLKSLNRKRNHSKIASGESIWHVCLSKGRLAPGSRPLPLAVVLHRHLMFQVGTP